jgi:hypothetical protein
MHESAPDLHALETLATSESLPDRAFAASELRRRADSGGDNAVRALYERVRATAARVHAPVRDRIRSGGFDRRALDGALSDAAREHRDHLLEEILGIAYPPLDAGGRAGEVVLDATSGVDEILFMIEHSGLGPGKKLVDLGAGAGKVVLLTATLTGATAEGLEIDSPLVAHANAAAAALGLGNRARFGLVDIRDAELPRAEVYYMYIPLIGAASLVTRLEPTARERRFVLFCQALDLARFPWLRRTGHASYWLEMYASV